MILKRYVNGRVFFKCPVNSCDELEQMFNGKAAPFDFNQLQEQAGLKTNVLAIIGRDGFVLSLDTSDQDVLHSINES